MVVVLAHPMEVGQMVGYLLAIMGSGHQGGSALQTAQESRAILTSSPAFTIEGLYISNLSTTN